MISKQKKQELILEFTGNPKDSGNVVSQIAILTFDIESLKIHFKNNKKDLHSKYGFFAKIEKRKKLVTYLRKTNFDLYKSTIKKLNIRK